MATSLPCSGKYAWIFSIKAKSTISKVVHDFVFVPLNRSIASSNTSFVAVDPVGLLGYVK